MSSSIPTKQIDGDVAIGRDANVGGKATVRGSMKVGHNLTVEGWLEAKNIKGPNKGLFKTAQQLREAYPNPHEGWWALVTVEGSASSDHLGQLYVADGGTWVAQVDSSGNPLLKGNPTVDSTEYMEAVEEMTADLEAVKVDVNQNKEDIKSLRSTQTSHANTLNTLSSQMSTAQTDITTLKKTVSDNKTELAKGVAAVQSDLDTFKDTKGEAGGLAPLDKNGQLSSQYLPSYVDDALEFGGIVSDVTAQMSSVSKNSDDENCSVVYNKTTDTFLLKYSKPSESEFDLRPTITYYNNWLDGDLFGEATLKGRVPHSGKIFMDVSTNKTYRWAGTKLAVIGSDLALGHTSGTAFPGDEGAELQERTNEVKSTANVNRQLIEDNANEVLCRNVIDANRLLSRGSSALTFSVVLEKMSELEYFSRYKRPGIVVTFLSEQGVQNKQWTNYGKQTDEEWKTEANWTDFGSNGSAIGNTVNVNDICDDTEYTLSTAIKAVLDKEKESGLSYMKAGVVLTYKTADGTSNGSPKWEAYQFTRNVEDINPADLKPWVEFGGGGNNAVPTSDTPEKDGKEAFSTGGAYANIPNNLRIDTETQGVVKLQLENAEHEAVGDEVQFAVGGGGGESTGTIVSIQFEQSPLYAKAGGSVVMKAAVRSITTQGNNELSNMIEKVVLKDRDTGQTLETFMFNRASSASGDTYDFEMDVSSYFVTATTKRFQLIAYDDAGNTGSRNINVSGVDVTISSVQTLNYTSSTSLAVGGAAKSIPMYKFANNASDKGIKVITEIYMNGEWKTLGEQTILDTYSHSITVDPKSCLTEALTHGAYPLRIHGEDVGSGVRGNYLHTAIMVVEAGNNTPIIAMRWYTDQLQGKRKLYENIEIDYAVYVGDNDEPQATILYDGAKETTAIAYRQQTNTYTKQVLESVHDGTKSVSVQVTCGDSQGETATFVVDGSLVDVEEVTTLREFNITMDSRSNGETDKSIKDGSVEVNVENCNWSSNGFVKDTYGTPTYGTENDKGRMALRIAEDMKARCTYKPFSGTSIEQNGLALSFTIKVKNVEDRTARLIDCLGDNSLGFYVTGEKLVFTCDGATAANPDDLGAQQTAVALYATDKETRFDIVIEPTSIAPYSGIGSIKIYVNGDEAAATYYNAGRFAHNDMTMLFDGTKADIYLYRLTAWATYYNYRQAFNNYLVGQKDTTAMLTEYEKNQVMASQTAEGTTKDRPTLQACMNAGLCCVTLLKNADTPDIEQSYPGYLDKLDGDKKTKAYFDWVIRFPDRPWQDCKVYKVPTTNQGTTSSLRPIKNKKGKFKGCKIEMLHTEEDFKDNPTALAKFKTAQKMAAKSQIQVIDGGLWVKTITIKVDYSDSTGANNGATMELFNKVQRAMGADYMTPAQNAYNGEGTMNTSIDSVTCALFRTDQQSVDATNETYAYFHAKANFNVDKGNPSFFGFEKVSGYNGDCLNYGDFKELVAEKDQDINIFKVQTLAKSDELIASNIYMLSEYCGEKHIFLENDGTGKMAECDATADPTEVDKSLAEVIADDVKNYDWGTVYLTNDYKYVKYTGGKWKDTTGKMQYDQSVKKWTVTGRVLNPVECFEYLKYDSLCWLQGVNGIEDMMRLDPATSKPIWLSYYESRYPDDDDLNDLYAQGKKVPYNLYKWLRWTQDCSQDRTEADGDITIHGKTVAGTKENRLKKFCEELHEWANVKSTLSYVVGSDYVLAVDQRSKNMMITFYLDTNGLVRAYFNHWYDGDCVWLSDNDCGVTIPWDLDSKADPKHYYQGWNSVMFQQAYAGDKFWLDDKGSTTATLHDVAQDMRTAEADGIKIFSPDGCKKLWITDRIDKWAKITSSFDNERKYIENSKAGANYYYAVHGLRYEDLPVTFEKRFAYRDGFYQVGELYTNPFKMRAVGTDISIKITAAQDAFFGLGVDRADACVDSCYLKAGESYTLKSGMTATGSGTMLYVFGAKYLASLDVSGCTPKAEGWDISNCDLLQEIIIGGEDYTPEEGSGAITQLNMGNKSFLKRIDVRNTKITSIIASYCPRLTEVLASGSQLASIDLAETAPIETLQLPGTMTTLYFKNLPRLTYPGGLTIEGGMSKVTKMFLDECPKIDTMTLLRQITTAGALKSVRIPGINATASVEMLRAIKNSGAVGIDANGATYDESGQCSGLLGRWILTELVEDEEVKALQTYFPRLTVINSQFSMVKIDDVVSGDFCEKYSNPENETGADYDKTFVASGHTQKIVQNTHAYKCTYNSKLKQMEGRQLSDTDFNRLINGETFDVGDSAGEGFDIFHHLPHFWYKGVNDYKNQVKYIFHSMTDNEPLTTVGKKKEAMLSELLYAENTGIYADEAQEGETIGDNIITTAANVNAYRMDVEGMKQVRWPGLNHARLGAVFTDASGKIVGKFIMMVSHTYFDFTIGKYVFCDVPNGAKWMYFTSYRDIEDTMCLAVDSESLEAIEPEWTEHTVGDVDSLVGTYPITIDGLKRPRSISGAVRSKKGDGTSQTSNEWAYDSEGNPTEMPNGTLHFTDKDFQNCCRMRGEGYQLQDYEMHKEISNLWWATHGTTNEQAIVGNGAHDAILNSRDDIGMADTAYVGNAMNSIMGLKHYVGCDSEWMDYIAGNVKSYTEFYKNRCVETSDDPVDYVFHIYDPIKKTERMVQSVTSGGNCVVRVVHGAKCDILPSKVHQTDTSKYTTHYAAGLWFPGSRGRCVLRSGNYSNANSGLAYANAHYASSLSYTYYGGRLAFRGKFVIVD